MFEHTSEGDSGEEFYCRKISDLLSFAVGVEIGLATPASTCARSMSRMASEKLGKWIEEF